MMAHIDHPVQKLILSTMRTSRSLKRIGDRMYPNSGGFTPRTVITHIYRYGPKTISELSHFDHVSRQHMERIVFAAEKNGLVSLQPNPYRKRSRRVHLTDTGEGYAVLILHETCICLDELSAGIRLTFQRTGICPAEEFAIPVSCIERCSHILDNLRAAVDTARWFSAVEDERFKDIEKFRW